MGLIPEEELKGRFSLNLAPMVDFLYVVIVIFAILIVTKSPLFEEQIKLVKMTGQAERLQPNATPTQAVMHIAVHANGTYGWQVGERKESFSQVEELEKRLIELKNRGDLPLPNPETKVLLHIDKQAQWKRIAAAIFGIKKIGYQIHPVFEMDQTAE